MRSGESGGNKSVALREARNDALLIGLGAGHTATALRHLGYERIDLAEFADGIVRAADQCFRGLNEGILSDPRVHLHLEDARNVLLSNRSRTYDPITIEITSIWFAYAHQSLLEEFYELAQKAAQAGRCSPTWVQLHYIGPGVIRSRASSPGLCADRLHCDAEDRTPTTTAGSSTPHHATNPAAPTGSAQISTSFHSTGKRPPGGLVCTV